MKVFTKPLLVLAIAVLSFNLVSTGTKLTETKMNYESYIAETDIEIAKLQDRLNKKPTVVYRDKEFIGDFTITHYDACVDCCGKTDGITASGAKVCSGVTVAVDPSVIPLGTYIYIDGIGYRVAQDTGGAIKGNRIDVYVHSHEQALELGTKTAKVWRMKDEK